MIMQEKWKHVIKFVDCNVGPFLLPFILFNLIEYEDGTTVRKFIAVIVLC